MVLRRCHTARPYPRIAEAVIWWEPGGFHKMYSFLHGQSVKLPQIPLLNAGARNARQRPPRTLDSQASRTSSPPPPTTGCCTATMAPVMNSLLVLLSCVVLGFAHNMQLKAHSRECFHEMLHADDRMTVTFQVGDREFGGSGNLDLDFWVRGYFCQTTNGKSAVGLQEKELEMHAIREDI